MNYFLGIDIGGTKSHALIADETGRAVGFGRGGAGNHEVVGYEGLAAMLRHVTRQAVAMAGIDVAQIAGAGLGVAGYDWPSELEPTLTAIRPLGLAAPIEVVNDTIIGLVAGAESGWGVAVIAGTSNNCWGWDEQHRIGRVMGNGSEFGENGGSAELVQRASQGYYDIGPEAAPLVFQVAEAGDEVAADAIRWAGDELASLAIGVIRQLGFETRSFEVVLVGSMYNGGRRLLGPMAEAIHAAAPGARLVRLTAPPVVGAVLIGMQAADLPAQHLRQPLIASTRALFGPGAANGN
jgi:N-acetylglucosamine kinase-like BadF-type ATPase